MAVGFIGFIKVWLPSDLLSRCIGSEALCSITKTAVIGAPLPVVLLECFPAAMSLRRSGAPSSSTVSFLIATAETGVASISLSYTLLGAVIMLIRAMAAIISTTFLLLMKDSAPPMTLARLRQLA